MPESTPKNEAKTPAPTVKAEAPKATPTAGEKKPETPAKAPDPKAAPAPSEKKPDAPAKAPDPKAALSPGEKKSETPAKAPDPKAAPAPGEKKPEAPAKAPAPKAAPAPSEKKPEAPAKAPDPKAAPVPGEKKPEAPAKAPDPKAAPAPGEKKPEAPAKTPDSKAAPAAGEKKPEAPAKAPDPKTAPAPGEKKPDPPVKAANPKAAPVTGEKKPEAPAKAPDPKAAPDPGEKKPDAPAKAPDPKAAPAPGEKKPEAPAKTPDPKATPAPGEKKPEAPAKAPDPKAAPAAGEKNPETPIKASDPKDIPAADPKPKNTAAEPPKGVRITQVLADRLEKPSEGDLKKIPQPKEGEGISMRLHPGYFFEFLDHPFSVNRETQDYKELFDSIRENGINEPIKARPREGGGLELISGHRRHDVAKQLNYPVPVVIVQMDDDSAKIEVVDGNLHRQDIPTSELARAAKMKLDALTRKAGRRSKMEQLAGGPQKRTDQIVAEDMGMSRNQVQRLVRIDSLIPGLKTLVDEKTLPFNTAVELSHLNPTEQRSVAEYISREQRVPTMAQAQELKAKSQEAAKAAKTEKTAGAISSHNYTPSLPSSLKVTTPAPAPTPVEKKAPAPVTDKTIASIMKSMKEPEIKVTFTGDELRSYFDGKQPTVPEAKKAVFEAMDMRKKVLEKQAQKAGHSTPSR